MIHKSALLLLRAHSPYGAPLESHCHRVFEFALALGEHRGLKVDRDMLLAGCYLHDIGLCVADPSEPGYLRRGLAFVREATRGDPDWELDASRSKILVDVMLYNHSLRPVPGIDEHGELVRLAVQVEHSRGWIRHGLSRAFYEGILRHYGRCGFDRVLVELAKTVLLEDGPAQLRGIFFPRGPRA